MVYVVQEMPGRNITPAMKYGTIKVLLPEGKQIGFSAGQVTRQLYSILSNFKDEDYLLLSGDPICIGIATAIASHWNNGKVKMLKWDRQEGVYFPVQIDIHSIEERKNDENGTGKLI